MSALTSASEDEVHDTLMAARERIAELERRCFDLKISGYIFQAAYQEVLIALEALVNERQPLGIDRPTYQAALKVIDKMKGGAV